MNPEHELLRERISEHSRFAQTITEEIGKVIVGQKQMIERLLIGLLCRGHILLEGVPGLAKTLAIRSLAQTIRTGFQRIQFTPDLLPADLVGTMIFDQKESKFYPRKGPLFSNLILADEINRAPAKVQSALLEAMQERQITIGETTFRLDEPFLVLATQNPIEQEGTYPLPEAQVDRFMLKLRIGYPTRDEERMILDRMTGMDMPATNSVATPDEIIAARKVTGEILLESEIRDYIVALVFATRPPDYGKLKIGNYIQYGASPRATIYLALAARAHAFLSGRHFVVPEDVKAVGTDVLRHRIILTYEAEAEEITSEDILQMIFDGVPVP